MGHRLSAHHIDSTEFARREWREILITTPDLHRWISGVILHEETAGQITLAGERFPAAIAARGMVPGIKVDRGTVAHGDHGETVTQGLDGLADRLEHYRELGLRFAKWRAAIRIDDQRGLPTRECIDLNVDALARYAA
jgi:fructose-bisphosphate aldolase class I